MSSSWLWARLYFLALLVVICGHVTKLFSMIFFPWWLLRMEIIYKVILGITFQNGETKAGSSLNPESQLEVTTNIFCGLTSVRNKLLIMLIS